MLDLNKLTSIRNIMTDKTFCLAHDNWIAEYEKDKKIGGGKFIEISDPNVIVDGMKANNDSLFDPRFDIPTDVDKKVIEWACDCESRIGRYNENRICPVCNTAVTIRYSLELLRRGWIDIENHFIMVPSMYFKVSAFIGNTRMKEIMDYDANNPIKPKTSANPFIGIGIIEFRNRFDEIMNFYKGKKFITKPELYDVIMERKELIFTDKLYVMSSAHRAGFVSTSSRSFNYHSINALFVKILTDFNLIKRNRRKNGQVDEIIGNIQDYMNKIYELTIAKLIGKQRLIRNNIVSGRLWYSSRLVIISETKYDDIDVCRVSYKSFIGLFELEIINCMLRGHGNHEFAKMSAPECRTYMKRVKNSDTINDDIYTIIDMLLNKRKDDGLYVIVNRNPSFDLGSIQMYRIIEVTKDAENDVLTIPHNSLQEFNGDYDGDTLNIYSPKERSIVDAFKAFLPSNLIIDRAGGYFNHKMTPIKDEYAFLGFLDSDYKPIDHNTAELKTTEEILSKLDEPFQWKDDPVQNIVKQMKNPLYFSREVSMEDPFDGDENYVVDGVYDPMDEDSNKDTVMQYDPFENTKPDNVIHFSEGVFEECPEEDE